VAEVVTGEAVVLEVPCARFPSRLLALAIDLAIQLTVVLVLLAIVGLSAADKVMDKAAVQAIVVTVIVLTVVGYPIIWETTTRGRSPGKFALGLRVVSDDGGPERFRQALVRGLATIVDFWLVPFIGVPALISSLLSDKGKRLGDIFAGTFVIQQRLPARRAAATPPAPPPELAAWASGLEMSGLNDQTAAMARRYLNRLPELTPSARAELGERIAAAIRAQVGPPPPGTPAAAYLSAVLTERYRREHARLMAPGAPGSGRGAAPLAGTAPGRAGWVPPGAPAPPPAPAWAPPGSPQVAVMNLAQVAVTNPPQVPVTEWMGAAWEGEGSQPGQPAEPGEPASPPAAGTGFVPPQ
jgi:uncharacterized RDD family membrane protein YckC